MHFNHKIQKSEEKNNFFFIFEKIIGKQIPSIISMNKNCSHEFDIYLIEIMRIGIKYLIQLIKSIYCLNVVSFVEIFFGKQILLI